MASTMNLTYRISSILIQPSSGIPKAPVRRLGLLIMLLGVSMAGSSATAPERGQPSQGKVRIGAAPTVTIQRPKFDYSGIGGMVYATGLGEVTVTVHSTREFISDGHHPYPMTVSLLQTNREILLGSNRKKATLNLGRLDRGELRLVARCDSGDGTFESGPGERNRDGAPHSRVKEIRPGVVEVYFENTMVEGKRNDRQEQHWYKDFKLTFTGAVTADSGVVLMLNLANDSNPATRDAARQALKTGYPMMARQAGIP
ncbi:MAG: hypothetical protein JNK85_27000 [Verrucomicrobiales bacterium]|nr:hypothetical protein [Verrucomicrobiales bacterium]